MSNDKGMVTVKAVTPVSTDDTDDLSSFVLITHERAFTLSWTHNYPGSCSVNPASNVGF